MTQNTVETRAEKARARKAVLAAGLGNALEWYDIILFGFMATSITAVFYPGEGLSAQLMTWATFAITFVVRPLGAVIIGRYSDKHGRKSALSLTIGLMTLGVFIIVVLPGESVIGVWAAIGLIIARIIQGISAGGEFGSATAFLTENAKHGKAFYASFQTATQGISMFLAAGISWIFSSTLSEEALHSWGWRVAFAIGLLIGPVGWYIRSKMEDTPEFKASVKIDNPLRTLLGEHFGRLVAAFLIIAMATISVYLITFLPQFAVGNLGLEPWAAFPGAVVAGVITLIGSPFAGKLADKVGATTVMIPTTIVGIIVAWPMFILLTNHPSIAILTVCEAIVGLFMVFYFGPMPALLSELFPVQVRSSGMTIAYSLGVAIFGGFAPLILTALLSATGELTVPGFYYAALSLLSLVGVIIARRVYKQR
ncbi:MFS transporter, MHS family, proline/betaine transporter [Brevibacterium sp. 239c]|uniref:MFS transporter n=1 Tax=Brevibacterium sp. 239c TaxID=1965356 RepID=UPI000C40123A|nr:MFS transporter [Brevibacterium sp. 239c]SMX93854.1 MFS transporter, MHS family, proline/betaine transporter [Brevibacterium sp. 239c]